MAKTLQDTQSRPRVRITIPVPFALESVNAWLFQGDNPVLVDCGLGSKQGYQTLHDALRAAGQDPGELNLFVTHGHVDHAGNAKRLQDAGATLHAPREEAPFIETFRRDSRARNDAFADALRLHGMPQEEVRAVRARSDGIDAYLDDCPIQADVPDGFELLFGDQPARAVRTPGHTPGSVCFEVGDDVLVTGDTLLETITSNAIELLEKDRGSHHTYQQTLDSLRRYAGRTALPGHRDPFVITEEVLDLHAARHEKRAKRILEHLDQPRTAWQLLPRVFPPKLGQDQWFLAMADLVGHLHALEIEGRVRATTNGVRVFSR